MSWNRLIPSAKIEDHGYGSVKIVYSGGYTRMQDYTFDVFFEAERSRGTGYVYLDLQGRYDISIVSYTMESDTPVSLNGMVEYKLQ